MDRFDASWTYTQTNYHKRWERNWKLYNNQSVDRGYKALIRNVFVPITNSTVETLVSAMSGKTDWDFESPRPDQKTDALNALVDQYAIRDHWSVKDEDFIRRCLREGTTVDYVEWVVDHPERVAIPIRDFFISPNFSTMETDDPTFCCGRRYLTTQETLKKAMVIDPDTGELVQRFKNLKDVKTPGSSQGSETAKEQKDMFYGSTVADAEKHQVEVIELWTVDKIYSIANRSVCIEERENPHKTRHKLLLGMKYLQEQTDPLVPPTQEETEAARATALQKAEAEAKGLIPFFYWRDFADESLFYGTSTVDTIASRQEELNDLESQISDFLAFCVQPGMTLEERFVDDVDKVVIAPGGVYPYGDALKPIQMPVLPPEAFARAAAIKNDIRETTGVSEVIKGTGAQQEATATEIRAQTAQAGARIARKVNRFESEPLDRLARIVVSMVQLYVTKPVVLSSATNGGEELVFDPNEFQEEYIPHVTLETEVEAKKQEEMKSYENMYAMLSQDPSINQEELKKMALPKVYGLSPDEVDKLITLPEPMFDPMADPAMAGLDPSLETMPQEVMV